MLEIKTRRLTPGFAGDKNRMTPALRRFNRAQIDCKTALFQANVKKRIKTSRPDSQRAFRIQRVIERCETIQGI